MWIFSAEDWDHVSNFAASPKLHPLSVPGCAQLSNHVDVQSAHGELHFCHSNLCHNDILVFDHAGLLVCGELRILQIPSLRVLGCALLSNQMDVQTARNELHSYHSTPCHNDILAYQAGVMMYNLMNTLQVPLLKVLS
jgi:hypothetical protein